MGEDPDEARARVDAAIDALHAVIRDIRTFIFGLRPLLLDSGSVMDGLGTLADELRRNTAIEVEIRGEAPPDLSVEVVAELLAIAREALANMARHSAARHAELVLSADDGRVRLLMADDGQGFDPTATPAAGHHGLANMRARAERLGGTMAIERGDERGTRIIVDIPRTEPPRGSSQ